MDPIRIALENPDRCLWLGEDRRGLYLKFQDGDRWSARFPCLKRDLELVSMGVALGVEYTSDDGTSAVRIVWRGGILAEWETTDRTIIEHLSMPDLLAAIGAV